MELYRIAHQKYIDDISGFGAKTYGGRWNRIGVPVLYTSQARSLALLELIVHFVSEDALLLPYAYLTLSVPDQFVITLDQSHFGNDLNNISKNVLSNITEEYFYSKRVLALKVPSALVPHEFNVLLNPLHENYDLIIKKNKELIMLDKRLKVI